MVLSLGDGQSHGLSARYGMRTQLQPVRLKTHALLGSVQKPSHVGASACPQGVVRHSHEPLDAAAEQTPPAPHCPWHWPSVKRHGCGGRVVVVLGGAMPTGPRFAGAHMNWAPLKMTIRDPNWSAISAVGVNGRLHFIW